MRILAIDLGAKRIGLALSDEGENFATPLVVLTVSSPAIAVAPIIELVKKESVGRIVVGLPLNMDNTTGPAAREAIAWGRDLAGKAGVPVIFVDERLSSFHAEQQLIEQKRAGQKLTRNKKKQHLDALAAASFLQAYLDGTLAAIEVRD